MLRYLDYPPIWLLSALGLVWVETEFAPHILAGNGVRMAGNALIMMAIVLIVAATAGFVQARSTIIPHKMPRKLITGGIFRLSRNPIYLADVLLLVGFSLRWGAVSGLALAPVLAWVLHRRFILGEEARLRAAFGAAADAYFARTRRWL